MASSGSGKVRGCGPLFESKGHCRTNPRKLIKLWAEKEFRNLKRMREKGLPCPTPVKIKDHVMIMEFIGEGSKAAPSKSTLDLNSTAVRAQGREVI